MLPRYSWRSTLISSSNSPSVFWIAFSLNLFQLNFEWEFTGSHSRFAETSGLWYVTCRWVNGSRRFERWWLLHLQVSCGLLGLPDSCRTHCDRSKRREPLIQWHTITSQNKAFMPLSFLRLVVHSPPFSCPSFWTSSWYVVTNIYYG